MCRLQIKLISFPYWRETKTKYSIIAFNSSTDKQKFYNL